MTTSTELSTKSIPNFRTKKFGIFINKFNEQIEKDFLHFSEQFRNYECADIDFEMRAKNYRVWRAFTNHTEFRLKYIKKKCTYIANNYNEVKERIGIKQLSNDNKFLYEEMNQIYEDMKTYKNQLSNL
jgi:esterase/lipase